MALPTRPQAVIFDCDGVLVDSEPITNAVQRDMLNEQGLDFNLARTMTTFVGRSVKDSIPEIEGWIGRTLPPDWHPEFVRRRDEALAREVGPVDGIDAVIRQLIRNDMPFAVASGADRPKMRLTLGRSGLLEHFAQRMFGSDMVARTKPAPDVYLLAMRTLGLDPARVVVVEDTPTGTRAGVAAGATVYGLAGHMPAEQLRAAGAALTFTAMRELPALLALD